MKTFKIIFVIISLITIITETIIIKIMKTKMANISIFTVKSDSMTVVSPYGLKGKQILFTSSFYDKYSHYHSPFRNKLSFNDLLQKYIRSRWTDYYGAKRGTRNCRRMHEGIDLFTPENTPVYPLADFGIVVFATDNPHYMYKVGCKRKNGKQDSVKVEYGKIVRIVYPEGIESIYAHLNKVFVKTGDIVGGKTKVGLTGRTGNLVRSGKPSHLHMELRDYKNRSFNPKHRLYYDRVNIENFLKNIKVNKDM